MAQHNRLRIIAPPPLLLVVCITGGIVAEHFLSLPFVPGSGAFRTAISIVLVVLAAAIACSAFWELFTHRTSSNPYRETSAFVSTGIYRFTRNPLYVSILLTSLGVAIAVNSLWLMMATAVLFILLQFGVVKQEEEYLSIKFGSVYEDYCRQVRRWL